MSTKKNSKQSVMDKSSKQSVMDKSSKQSVMDKSSGKDRIEAKVKNKPQSASRKPMEMLPSDGNDNADISPHIAFLSYN